MGNEWGDVVSPTPAAPRGSTEFEREIASGDVRRALVAMRDEIAHELSVNHCHTCMASKLRTGDQAALFLRLEQTISKLAELVDEEEGLTDFEKLRLRGDQRRGNVIPIRPEQVS